MKIFLSVLTLIIFIAGCGKKDQSCSFTDSNSIAPAAEVQQLQDSLNKYAITAIKHSTGFFYKINTQGSGTGIANLCTNISVSYKGSFFNGKIFDSTITGQKADFQLGEVLVGWQKGVPLISKGGDIDLYIPPSLAYGSTPRTDNMGNVVIPANSYLVFNIHIIEIQ